MNDEETEDDPFEALSDLFSHHENNAFMQLIKEKIIESFDTSDEDQ